MTLTSPYTNSPIFTARDDIAVEKNRDAINKRRVSRQRIYEIPLHGPYSDFARYGMDIQKSLGESKELNPLTYHLHTKQSQCQGLKLTLEPLVCDQCMSLHSCACATV